MELIAKSFFLLLGAFCLIHFIIAYPYSLYEGTEYVFGLRILTRYVIISLIIAVLIHLQKNRETEHID